MERVGYVGLFSFFRYLFKVNFIFLVGKEELFIFWRLFIFFVVFYDEEDKGY